MPKLKSITLTTQKQLDIFMNPQRQRLLKALNITGRPMTSKELSDILGISSSSVSHHIKKLEQLGVVELDHTESIHGIQAKYYRKVPVSVSMGGNRDDDLKAEREVLADYIMTDIWNGLKKSLEEAEDKTSVMNTGDFLSGIVHLRKEEAQELYQLVLNYTQAHSSPGEDTVPWEYGLTVFPHKSKV